MNKEAKTERKQNKGVPQEVLENKLKKLAMTIDVKAKVFLDACELMGAV